MLDLLGQPGMYCAANSRRRSLVSRESTFTLSTSRRIRSRTARNGRLRSFVNAGAHLDAAMLRSTSAHTRPR